MVDVLTYCALFHSVCDLIAIQMNVQCSLIWELILYNFQQGYNTARATKNICYMKSEWVVDYKTVTRWLKKFCLGCKKHDNQAKSGRPKIIDSEVVCQSIKANPTSSTQRLSCKLSISQSSVAHHLHNLIKSIQQKHSELWLTLLKYCKNFDSPYYLLSWTLSGLLFVFISHHLSQDVWSCYVIPLLVLHSLVDR